MQEQGSIGKALRKALGLEPVKLETEPRVGGRSLLMNPKRLAIFSYLWEHPGSHVRQTSRATGIPVETLKWHLRAMERAGLLGSFRSARRLSHYPKGLVMKDDASLFALLAETTRAEIVKAILETDGGAELAELSRRLQAAGQAVRHHVALLERGGVIETSGRRRPMRYLIHREFDALAVRYERRSGKVLEWLLAALQKDCLDPRVRERGEGSVKVRISPGTQKKTLEFALNPLRAVASRKGRACREFQEPAGPRI